MILNNVNFTTHRKVSVVKKLQIFLLNTIMKNSKFLIFTNLILK
jgi:hypothetical protein